MNEQHEARTRHDPDDVAFVIDTIAYSSARDAVMCAARIMAANSAPEILDAYERLLVRYGPLLDAYPDGAE